MKKVLVAIDIARSGGNDTCIKTAQHIAGVMGATLTLLHVLESIPRYVVPSMPAGIFRKRKSEAEEKLRKLKEPHNCSDMITREGFPATEILECASDINADLIVLHSHDPGLLNYLLAPSPVGRFDTLIVRCLSCATQMTEFSAYKISGVFSRHSLLAKSSLGKV